MTKRLVEIIAQISIFLEFSGEEVIQVDIAVQQQEEIAFRLQKLSETERQEFIRLLHEIALENSNQEQRSYLLRLPEYLGLL